MQKLIEKLFELQGMERKDLPELELYEYSEPDKTGYWLVIHGEPELSPELQGNWLSECKKATVDPALEKNINLLIAWQTESLNEKTSKMVHHAEEDSYFFKKHVLPYTFDELEALLLIVEQNGLESVFRNVLTDTQTFTAYKAQYNQGGWQSLLYRLAIKVSALTIQGSSKADLTNLEQNIQGKVLKSPNAEILRATELALSAITERNTLHEIAPENLLALMTAELGRDGYELDC
ncbi:ABC-three component system middle component 1 [Enterovibrio norvegicus]|uniref:Uncharacterized protein n=1 Tax=Enterovibrio norvegicus DSM 15893 TaxID=1121869 RepID=A0A1I5MEA0_9GAMM|nr:ABC-three component system middle component 1 [Enterovibrio norvegicus]SFP07948.1 hypothetical protein SAMN03084138_01292 [Enterovibrio norvegicus DSM 15893]